MENIPNIFRMIGIVTIDGEGGCEDMAFGNSLPEVIGNMHLKKLIPSDFGTDDNALIYNVKSGKLAAFLTKSGWQIL